MTINLFHEIGYLHFISSRMDLYQMYDFKEGHGGIIVNVLALSPTSEMKLLAPAVAETVGTLTVAPGTQVRFWPGVISQSCSISFILSYQTMTLKLNAPKI